MKKATHPVNAPKENIEMKPREMAITMRAAKIPSTGCFKLLLL
jgi:hypothetical protein